MSWISRVTPVGTCAQDDRGQERARKKARPKTRSNDFICSITVSPENEWRTSSYQRARSRYTNKRPRLTDFPESRMRSATWRWCSNPIVGQAPPTIDAFRAQGPPIGACRRLAIGSTPCSRSQPLLPAQLDHEPRSAPPGRFCPSFLKPLDQYPGVALPRTSIDGPLLTEFSRAISPHPS